MSSKTSQSVGTRIVELSTITTPSLQEEAMDLSIWNLTNKFTGHGIIKYIVLVFIILKTKCLVSKTRMESYGVHLSRIYDWMH